MSRLSSIPDRAKATVGVLLLALTVGAAACDEDGKTTPERCADPALPIFDIQTADEPADDNAQYPCVTQVGHSISSIGTPDTGGTTSTGGATTGGKGGGAAGGSGDTGGAADAGAGGA
jgi:hypothetical protein